MNQPKKTLSPTPAWAVILAVAAVAGAALAIGRAASGQIDRHHGTDPSPRAQRGDTAVSTTAESGTSFLVPQGLNAREFCGSASGTTVPTGSEAEARRYYAAAAREIGLSRFDTLDAMLAYLGYPVSAATLQDTPPADMIGPTGLGLTPPLAPGAVLAARFFAPKITDVSQEITPASLVGWRKLVRLLPRDGSTARVQGIDSAYILFNFFARLDAPNPFERADSLNTQVMLIASRPDRSPVYWFDYGQTSAGAQISHQLDAFFDAGHAPSRARLRAYYVPCACVACHGGRQLNRNGPIAAPVWNPTAPLLNYLDTDHWFDRVGPGQDFAGLAAPVIFDPGGFEVIRTLNQEMRDQNRHVQPGSVQERAASHWIDLHATTPGHVADLTARALPDATGRAWSASDPTEVTTLGLLNRYCFRCHGSVEFDVFDQSMVLSLRTQLLSRLQQRGALRDPRATMPPDRDMPRSDREALRAFIRAH